MKGVVFKYVSPLDLALVHWAEVLVSTRACAMRRIMAAHMDSYILTFGERRVMGDMHRDNRFYF